MTPDVIVCGAGIGGLTLSLMLKAHGIESAVYEQAGEVREIGVGINTLPHAIKELAGLGLLGHLDEVAIRTKELIYINRQGQTVWQEPRGLDAGFDFPQFSVHRGRLQKVLYDAVLRACGPDSVKTGRRLAGYIEDEGGVRAIAEERRRRQGAQRRLGAGGSGAPERRHPPERRAVEHPVDLLLGVQLPGGEPRGIEDVVRERRRGRRRLRPFGQDDGRLDRGRGGGRRVVGGMQDDQSAVRHPTCIGRDADRHPAQVGPEVGIRPDSGQQGQRVEPGP